ncbi:MAG: hypothetical protein ACI81P_003341 [Neolewinella sp.]|jgi:hypothetical protein
MAKKAILGRGRRCKGRFWKQGITNEYEGLRLVLRISLPTRDGPPGLPWLLPVARGGCRRLGAVKW